MSVRYHTVFARGRAHEGGDVQPLEAVVPQRDRPLSPGRPHRAEHRLQAEAVLVGAEHLDGDAGGGRPPLRRRRPPAFFETAAASSAVADFGFLGRGRCNDQPSAFSASQRALRQDALQPEVGRHDVGHLAARPQPTVGRRLGQPQPHRVQHLGPSAGSA